MSISEFTRDATTAGFQPEASSYPNLSKKRREQVSECAYLLDTAATDAEWEHQVRVMYDLLHYPEQPNPVDRAAIHLPALIAETFGGSRSEARRLIAQGGVRVNGEVVTELDLQGFDLSSDGVELQVGRIRRAQVRIP